MASRPSRRRARALTTAVFTAAIAATILGGSRPVHADEAAAPPPPNYAVAVLGTTIAHRANGGSFEGWQHDLSPAVGYGRLVSDTIAIELDLGPTYVRGDYLAFALIPGVVWAFSPHAYAAARFIVPVDPQLDFALFPGFGLITGVTSSISVSVEGNLFSYVGRGDPDFGIALTAGAVYAF